MSHNIKSIYKIIRYAFALLIIIYALAYPLLWLVVFAGLSAYSFWAFRKVYDVYTEREAGFWGIFLQFTTDFVVIGGFIKGLWEKLIPSGV